MAIGGRHIATGEAPGRVNLIGEHTDYHEGFVLPTVIPQHTHVRMEARDDDVVRVHSDEIAASREEYRIGEERPGRGWLDYVAGVTAMLRRRGVPLSGLDIRISSQVPLGAGVSSSAALLVALIRAARALLSLDLDDVAVALLARQAETDFVGTPVGVMDQMAASLGASGEALFIDTRSLQTERVSIPPSLDLLVIHSGVTHAHAGGEYRTRRDESFRAAALLGLRYLRDADPSWLPRIGQLPDVLARRARHIVTENKRVLEAVVALRSGDAERLGALFAASQASMRDDYEISTSEIDALVRIGTEHRDVYGARMTGGGFGGSVVMLTKSGRASAVGKDVMTSYRGITGCEGRIIVPEAREGQPPGGHASWT